MTSATVHRRAHLETVIEFEMEPEAAPEQPHDRGERALHLRRLLAVAGAAIGLAAAASIGTGIATAPAPPTHTTAPAAQAPLRASCSAVAAPLRPGEPHLRCTVPVPTAPSAEVAMRAARDAALARARAQTHGPGAGTARRWDPDSP